MKRSPPQSNWRRRFEIEVVDLRTVKPLDTDTVLASVARTGACFASANLSVGRRDRGSDRARRGPKVFICSTPRRAHQRERHTDPISSKSLGDAQTERKRHRGKSARSCFENKFMPQVPIIMPQLGESIAEATIVESRSSRATKSRTIRKSSTSKRTKRSWA